MTTMFLWRNPTASVLCSVLVIACHHRNEAIAHSLEGVEFRAHARVSGTTLDTLAIDIVAANRSRREKILEFSPCGFRPRVSLYRIGEKKSAWDMDRWQESDAPSPVSQFRIERVCITSLMVMSLPAGATASLGAITLPLRVVFGDSLATGLYRITSMPGPINYRGKRLDAGTVDLRRPPERRALRPTVDPRGEKGVLGGFVIDSLSGEGIYGATVGFSGTSTSTMPEIVTTTSAGGAFKLHIPSSNPGSLSVRRFGYRIHDLSFVLSHDSAYKTVLLMQRAESSSASDERVVRTRIDCLEFASCEAETTGPPRIVVDGVILPNDVEPFENKFKKYLTIDQIEVAEPLMPGEALKRLGPLGRNGAVLYTSKKYVRDHLEKFPLLGPDDFKAIGSIVDLPSGRKVRLLQVLFVLAGRGPSGVDHDSLPRGVMIGTPEPGASMSLYISTPTPKSETQILEQESRDVIEHMKDQIATHDVRGITVIVCRSKACAELRGMTSETFFFRKYGSSWARDTRWDDR
jgi:hypothetical protein